MGRFIIQEGREVNLVLSFMVNKGEDESSMRLFVTRIKREVPSH